jgi:hypothetical protein
MNDKQMSEEILQKIEEKYGKQVVAEYTEFWTKEKERLYSDYIKNLDKNDNNSNLSKKLIIKDIRVCTRCKKYSLKYLDDFYLNKFGSCALCYIKHIEGRK